MNRPVPKYVFWPNSMPVFVASLLLLFLAGTLTGTILVLVLMFGAFFALRIQIAAHFITAFEIPGISNGTIIQKSDARVVDGQRQLGKCLVIDDRRSGHEIVIYKWLFNSVTLQRMRELIEGA